MASQKSKDNPNQTEAQMAANTGNSWWRLAGRQVRFDRRFNTPEELVEAVCDYFNWLHENPLEEEKLFAHQGETYKDTIQKPRPPTLQGLCAHIGITRTTWGRWRRKDDNVILHDAVWWAEDTMHAMKFEGASAGLMNPSLIIRDLGLSDKKELTGADGAPIRTQTIDPTKLDTETLEKILEAQVADEEDGAR